MKKSIMNCLLKRFCYAFQIYHIFNRCFSAQKYSLTFFTQKNESVKYKKGRWNMFFFFQFYTPYHHKFSTHFLTRISQEIKLNFFPRQKFAKLTDFYQEFVVMSSW